MGGKGERPRRSWIDEEKRVDAGLKTSCMSHLNIFNQAPTLKLVMPWVELNPCSVENFDLG